jgi:tetratricopeptide (TPR) repeat protein
MSHLVRTGRALGLMLLAGCIAAGSLHAQERIAEQVRIGQDGQPEGVKLIEPGEAPSAPFAMPELAPAVQTLLDADYLKDDERTALRVKHGAWLDADLANVKLRARAAIIRGDYLDAALTDAAAEPPVRAQALLMAGQCDAAIELLKSETSIAAARIRAEAMIDSGRISQAIEELKAAAARVVAVPGVTDADELAEGVRCALLLTRWQPPGSPTHQEMLALLAKARDELDRTSWKASLVEAQLLYEKDKYAEAAKVIDSVLTLNPRCTDAYWLFGLICVDTFDFARGERLASRLDALSEPSPSIHAACLRSYIRQRQNEGEAAAAQLERALAAYPTSRLLLGYQAASIATQFDFDGVDAKLAAFDGLAKGSPQAAFLVGRAMSGSRQYAQAATYLNKAVAMAPYWAEPVVELGLCEFQAGRNDAALAALEKAVTLDPINNRAANSLTLLRELASYVSVESDHFIVRCKPGIDEVVAREMLDPLEKIFERVTGNGKGGIDHKPAGKTVVELYPNHRWFGVRITGMPALHTIAAATGPVIAMEAPRDGAGHMGAFDWRRVVQHEYTHTVTLSRTMNRLPHWITEAGAVYLEDSPRDYSTVQILTRAFETNTLFDLDTINLMFVRPRRQTDRSQAYAQGHMMYEFIIERFGETKPLELMDLYAKGVREAAAFKQVLGIERAEFLPQFKDWMRTKLQEWGMSPTDAHPSIKTLLARDGSSGEEAANDNGPTPEQLEAWLKEMPASPFVLEQVLIGKLKASGGDATDEMLPMLKQYAAARPVDPLPHKLMAAFLLANDRGAEAVEHLEYLDAREQTSPGYAAELAKRYAAAGDMPRALAKSARATQIAPYDASYREMAAGIAIRAKDFTKAERHIRAMIALEPDRPIHQQRLEALLKMAK